MSIAHGARLLLLTGASILALASFGTPTLADNTSAQNKLQYELQEKCGKDAANFLYRLKTEDIPGGPIKAEGSMFGGIVDIESQSHYSARFNKCFLLINDKRTAEHGRRDDDASVWDVNSGRKIAGFWKTTDKTIVGHYVKWCWAFEPDHINNFKSGTANTASCGNLDDPFSKAAIQQWNALVRPYMPRH